MEYHYTWYMYIVHCCSETIVSVVYYCRITFKLFKEIINFQTFVDNFPCSVAWKIKCFPLFPVDFADTWVNFLQIPQLQIQGQISDL